ncbi:MAG: class I SAM-dependent methyltransferase [Lachnospiraceae bacterium]|nr:class I SAM-dependent methyltransferase [Lachnospiraceae bacterium]
MRDYSVQNKKAWEFDAYDFWVKQSGTPEERAEEDIKDPVGKLRKYARYFDSYEGVKIANICGSCGKKAIPLALLGAEVTVFDISEDNKRYATEVARAANTEIEYVVGDVLEIDIKKYSGYFDVVFMEGGILHYFHDIDEFMKIMNAILRKGGRIICGDFHPFTKIIDSLDFQMPKMSYFSTEIYEGEMAHARFYDEETRKSMPKCSYRKYTISEILNSMIANGFVIKRFDEHPSWVNADLPGEFTAIGIRE